MLLLGVLFHVGFSFLLTCRQIVGLRPSFAKAFKPDEPEAIRACLVSKAIEAKNAPPPVAGAAAPPPAPRTHTD